MKRLLPLAAVLLFVAAVFSSRTTSAQTTNDAARTAAVKLYESLRDDQKKLAVKDVSDKERYSEQFPAVERPGLPFSNMTKEQKSMVDDVIKAMTSEYGAGRCFEVAKQTPDNRRYLNFFGEPGADKAFACRIAQHHLTLLYAEFGKAEANEFGPILLGGNPVGKLWDDEEKIVLDLDAALTAEEAKAIQGGKASPSSGQPIGKAGIRIGDLGDKAKNLAKQLLAKRLDVFSADRRKTLDDIIKKDGGVENLRIAIWGSATKMNLDGGNYHWRIGSPSLVCDWQTAGKNHLHMTVRGKVKA